MRSVELYSTCTCACILHRVMYTGPGLGEVGRDSDGIQV